MNYKISEKEDFASFTAILDERGRIFVPSLIRRKFRLDSTSEVVTIIKPQKYISGIVK